jgi:hypothetical protein
MMPATFAENCLPLKKLPAGNFLRFDLKTPIEFASDAAKRGAANG